MRKAYLALLESMDLLYSCCDTFFSVFKVEGGIPLRTSTDFDCPIVLVLLLKFQDQVDRIALHLGFGERDLRNLFDFLIGIAFGMRGNLIIFFNFLGYSADKLGLISVRINHNHLLFLIGIQEGFLSISLHPTLFIYYMASDIILACIIYHTTFRQTLLAHITSV